MLVMVALYTFIVLEAEQAVARVAPARAAERPRTLAAAARMMFATACLRACVRCGVVRAKAFTGTLVGCSGGGILGVSLPVGGTTMGHRVLRHEVSR